MCAVGCTKAADLDYGVCSKLATVVDVQVRLIECFDGDGLRVLPSHHLEDHVMAAYVRQLLHCVGGLCPDLQPQPCILRDSTREAWIFWDLNMAGRDQLLMSCGPDWLGADPG